MIGEEKELAELRDIQTEGIKKLKNSLKEGLDTKALKEKIK